MVLVIYGKCIRWQKMILYIIQFSIHILEKKQFHWENKNW